MPDTVPDAHALHDGVFLLVTDFVIVDDTVVLPLEHTDIEFVTVDDRVRV